MGYGDEIMVTGHVRELYARRPVPVAVQGKDGQARWHEVWTGNPKIARPDQVAAGLEVQWYRNHSGHRPYVVTHSRERWTYNLDYQAPVGELYLPRDPPGGYVVVSPDVKSTASPNKRWPRRSFEAVVAQVNVDWVQLGPAGTRPLPGVRHILTRSFTDACRVLAGARALVTNEGGLHHAAAALGIPAVVIFGGMVPLTTGYAMHRNLAAPGEACGMRTPCPHCERAMASITPDQVVGALLEIIE